MVPDSCIIAYYVNEYQMAASKRLLSPLFIDLCFVLKACAMHLHVHVRKLHKRQEAHVGGMVRHATDGNVVC